MRIVVVNNDGGGIFEFLPQAGQIDREEFEALLGTPLGLEPERVAALYGIGYARLESLDRLAGARRHRADRARTDRGRERRPARAAARARRRRGRQRAGRDVGWPRTEPKGRDEAARRDPSPHLRDRRHGPPDRLLRACLRRPDDARPRGGRDQARVHRGRRDDHPAPVPGPRRRSAGAAADVRPRPARSFRAQRRQRGCVLGAAATRRRRAERGDGMVADMGSILNRRVHRPGRRRARDRLGETPGSRSDQGVRRAEWTYFQPGESAARRSPVSSAAAAAPRA